MTLMGLVDNWSGLMAARWFLGLCEAGLFPGVSFYLSCWYKRSELGVRSVSPLIRISNDSETNGARCLYSFLFLVHKLTVCRLFSFPPLQFLALLVVFSLLPLLCWTA
jgi:MFS family permease